MGLKEIPPPLRNSAKIRARGGGGLQLIYVGDLTRPSGIPVMQQKKV